jgi:hypothetical protein
MRIHYRNLWGYKYQLAVTYAVKIPIQPKTVLVIPGGWVSLTTEGVLRIEKGYCWDGPSGPTIDTRNFMRGSLVHDALYQLMRLMLLNASYRKAADELLRQHCIEDGMSRIRAAWLYRGLRMFAAFAAKPSPDPEIHKAP